MRFFPHLDYLHSWEFIETKFLVSSLNIYYSICLEQALSFSMYRKLDRIFLNKFAHQHSETRSFEYDVVKRRSITLLMTISSSNAMKSISHLVSVLLLSKPVNTRFFYNKNHELFYEKDLSPKMSQGWKVLSACHCYIMANRSMTYFTGIATIDRGSNYA